MSLGASGKNDWLIQRVSAVVMAVYAIALFLFVSLNKSNMSFELWNGLFSNVFVNIFSLLTLLSLCVHAWIGIWTVCTDYIKCSGIRLLVLSSIAVFLLACFVYGFYILWGL